ncbi:MAG: glycine zipper domain-containing protein [Pseudomonadota bacterium]
MLRTVILGASALLITACTTTGNVERGAATGATVGAVAGAIIGNNVGDGDAERGAIIGGALGGTAGVIRGRQQDVQSGEGTRLRERANGETLYYDQQARRYYYIDQRTGRSYWQNGQLRY